jgi:hypothetical protein
VPHESQGSPWDGIFINPGLLDRTILKLKIMVYMSSYGPAFMIMEKSAELRAFEASELAIVITITLLLQKWVYRYRVALS